MITRNTTEVAVNGFLPMGKDDDTTLDLEWACRISMDVKGLRRTG